MLPVPGYLETFPPLPQILYGRTVERMDAYNQIFSKPDGLPRNGASLKSGNT